MHPRRLQFTSVSKRHFQAALFTLHVPVVLLVGSVLLKSCNNPVPTSPSPGSWLVLLCKAADAPQEPHPKAFYQTSFSKSQQDLLFSYFDAASFHTVDVSNTEVYGWFPMAVKTAEIAPSVRNNGTSPNRSQTVTDCENVALVDIMTTGITADSAKYAGVITVINVPVDSGQADQHSVVASTQLDNEMGFMAHEMLHVLGLSNHSWRTSPDTSADHFWNHGGDVEYNDCWDIMSYRTCDYVFSTSRGIQGPELEEAYRRILNWLPAGRLKQFSLYPPGTNSVTLAPVSDPTKPGFLLAQIEVENQGYYVVEYGENTGFDKAIPYNAVVIRELRNDGITYLVQRQNGATGWRQGEMFTDSSNNISISVDSIVPGAATITINSTYSTSAPGVGDWCGDKYRGQVLTCPASTTCRHKTSGQLMSVDWYCLP